MTENPGSIPPPMPPPQAAHWQAQEQKDEQHITLLVVFHYVLAGFALLGVLLLFTHYYLMSSFFMNEEMWKDATGPPPPEEFFAVFRWFYAIGAAICVASAVLNVMAGVFMKQRRNRMFTMVVAGLNCMNMPMGTALGVFTIIVLMRPSVLAVYEAQEEGGLA